MNNILIIIFLSSVLFSTDINETYLKQLRTAESVSTDAQYRGVWVSDCAPWDGPAISISVSEKEISCTTKKFPYIEINIYKSESEISGQTFSFPDFKAGSVSKIVIIKNQKKNIQVKSGTVKFEEATKTTDFSGKFEVEFEDGEKSSGSFVAKKCERFYACG